MLNLALPARLILQNWLGWCVVFIFFYTHLCMHIQQAHHQGIFSLSLLINGSTTCRKFKKGVGLKFSVWPENVKRKTVNVFSTPRKYYYCFSWFSVCGKKLFDEKKITYNAIKKLFFSLLPRVNLIRIGFA